MREAHCQPQTRNTGEGKRVTMGATYLRKYGNPPGPKTLIVK